MMDCCQRFEDILFEPEEDLSKSDSAKLREHIETCETCRVERELFLESWSALEESDVDLDPCPMLRARVWEQIREEEKLPPPFLEPATVASFRLHFQRLTVAGLALLLGFGLGRGMRPNEAASPSQVDLASQSGEQNFLDPALLKLASEEGYSVEIFPESTSFSPLDQEMRSALAPTDEERTWLQQNRGSVVPVRYISQDGALRQ